MAISNLPVCLLPACIIKNFPQAKIVGYFLIFRTSQLVFTVKLDHRANASAKNLIKASRDAENEVLAEMPMVTMLGDWRARRQ